MGSEKRFRMFLAGNRVGKTLGGCAETVYHATGQYPKWWKGLRLQKPKEIWVAGVSLGAVRGALMQLYMGGKDTSDFGKGLIPKNTIVDYGWNRHASKVLDFVRVKHKAGHEVVIWFKAYEQGRDKFQSDKIDFIHLDEEPPEDIFGECAARTMGTGGGMILTMTPLKGMTEVCLRFLEPKESEQPFYGHVQATIWDNPFIPEDEKLATISGYEAHQLEARTKGIPALGSGMIYPVAEEQYLVEPFPIPDYWKFAYGLDFGWNSTAAVFAVVNPESRVVYLYDTYKQASDQNEGYFTHTSNLKGKGAGVIPGAGDPAGQQSNQKDGEKLMELFNDEGLDLKPADNSVEAGLTKILQMLRSGELKIFNTPEMYPLLREMRKYHRDEKGKVRKKDDHLCDAMRYLIMSGIKRARSKERMGDRVRRWSKELPLPDWRTT